MPSVQLVELTDQMKTSHSVLCLSDGWHSTVNKLYLYVADLYCKVPGESLSSHHRDPGYEIQDMTSWSLPWITLDLCGLRSTVQTSNSHSMFFVQVLLHSFCVSNGNLRVELILHIVSLVIEHVGIQHEATSYLKYAVYKELVSVSLWAS